MAFVSENSQEVVLNALKSSSTSYPGSQTSFLMLRFETLRSDETILLEMGMK